MILKEIDEKKAQIDTLKELLGRSTSKSQKKLIVQDLKKLENGYKNEAQNAYFINFELKDSKNIIVIHDIRLECNGRVAQIDHLLFTRTGIEIVESKSFNGAVRVKKDNSLEVTYGTKKYTYPNPLEQAKRHKIVLEDVLKEQKLLTNKIGFKFDIDTCVVFGSNTTVLNSSLPDGFHKAENFIDERDRIINSMGIGEALVKVWSVKRMPEVEKIANALVELHKPVEFDYEKKYKISKETTTKKAEVKEIKETPVKKNLKTTKGKMLLEKDSCPRCKEGKLIQKELKNKKYKDKYENSKFLGCNRFPKCKFSSKINESAAS